VGRGAWVTGNFPTSSSYHRLRPPRCLHHFVSHPAKEKGIGLVHEIYIPLLLATAPYAVWRSGCASMALFTGTLAASRGYGDSFERLGGNATV